MDWSPLWISLKTAIPATIITFFLGIYAAWKINKVNGFISHILDIFLTLPLVLPPTVAGFLLLMMLGKNGIFGRLLMSIGIQVIFTWTATVIAAIVVAFPLMYRSAKAAYQQVDANLISAGRTLGMSEVKIFWKIVIPLASPGIASGVILSFARALGEFGATLMIAGNIPKVTQTMPLVIYMKMQGGNLKEAGYWVWILVILSFAIIFFLNYFTGREKKYRLGGERK